MPQDFSIVIPLLTGIGGLWVAFMYMLKKQDARYDRQEERYDRLMNLLLDSLDVNDAAIGLAEPTVRGRASRRSSIEATVRGRRAKRPPPRGV